MAGGEIKQKILLEGEDQYKKALKDAQRNLKTLRSELKAETAELGRNATEQQKNEAKVKSLKAQIKEQEKIVKANKEALDEVRKKYADNEDAIAKWEQKLNESRTALANMKNELEGVGQSFKNVQGSADMATVAAKSVSDTIGKFSSIADSVSTSIESIFTNALSKTKEIIGEIWGEVMDTAARANSWADMAGMYDTSAANIQKWYHSVSAEGKDFAKVSNMVAKIVYGDNKKIAEAVGISAENYTDKWEYAMAVFDKLATMDHDAQKTALSTMGITGAKEEGWVDVLDAWGAIQGWTPKFDANAGGLGMTDEELDKADRLAKNMESIKTSWEALKDGINIKLFGDLALNITGNMQTIVEALNKYFRADNQADKDAAIEEIKKSIRSIFEAVETAIREGIQLLNDLATEMQNSSDPTEQALGNILSGIVSALEWLTEDHMKNVVSALEILAAFWIAGKGLAMITNVAAFAKDIALLKSAGMLKGITTAGGAAAGLGAAGTSGLLMNSSGLMASLGTVLSSTAVLVTLGAITALPLLNYLKNKGVGGVVEDFKRTGKEMIEKFPESASEVAHMTGEQGRNAIDFILSGGTKLPEKTSGGKTSGGGQANLYAGDNAAPSIPTIRTPQGKLSGYEVTPEQLSAWQAFWDELRSPEGIVSPETSQKFESAFNNNTELLGKLMNLMGWFLSSDAGNANYENLPTNWWRLNARPDDIPAEWWQTQTGKSGEQVTKEDLRSFRNTPEGIKQAVKDGLSNVKVIMDREAIGRLVVDQVSTLLAAGMVSP